jgi:hypothetical protein
LPIKLSDGGVANEDNARGLLGRINRPQRSLTEVTPLFCLDIPGSLAVDDFDHCQLPIADFLRWR